MTMELNHMMNQEPTPESQRALLNRRGKFITRGVPVILATAGLALTGNYAAHELVSDAAAKKTCVASEDSITVMNGESIWSIASAHDTGTDVGVTVNHFTQANPELAQPNHILHPGDTLSIPVCGSEK